MKRILVLGAGKSSPVLIDHLLSESEGEDWQVHVADIDASLVDERIQGHPRGVARVISEGDAGAVRALIREADIVISLLPPVLHDEAARTALEEKRHFLNASYVSPVIAGMDAEARAGGLSFLCEMGLDPGIDHMSAMRMVDDVRSQGGRVLSFRSHCGGLVAPESDDNPWHYKFSWNPRNVVMAGKDGARYLENGRVVRTGYAELFNPSRTLTVPGLGRYAWYPNRDSLSYIPKYGLEGTPDFVRTTLRHPDFCFGWRNLVNLGLTNDEAMYDTDGMTLSGFFQIHFDRFGFSDWLQEVFSANLKHTRRHLENLIELMEADKARPDNDREGDSDALMLVNARGDLRDVSVSRERQSEAGGLDLRMHEANLILSQLFFLGIDSGNTIDIGRKSAAGVLQWILERRLALGPHDRDMVVMMHELESECDGVRKRSTATFWMKGVDNRRTAMAFTVGMPLAVAATMILKGELSIPGVRIPVERAVYEKVLPALERHGILFREGSEELSTGSE